ncbi:hypothetical protein BVG80_07665 [Sphingobacteriales bacterium TSM_CSM]|nr:hypothetical protein BVG80_07665 [Sphingobacteriales bacterium TSM_CSM]
MTLNRTILEQETWFVISNYHHLRPFLMSVVSHSNHWMFISSNGGLTAGRKNSQFALFPYYTDDKLTEFADITGSKTILQIAEEGTTLVWEPFADRCQDRYAITRNLYKNTFGNKVLFEEINHSLGLVFRYQWNTGHEFGFVKQAELVNTSGKAYRITILDGIQNIMPAGVSTQLQTNVSNLVDAYKRSELLQPGGLGIFALSAIIVDKAEPSEALKANIAWSLGLENVRYLLSSVQVNKFRQQQLIQEECDVKGEKGAYFVHATVNLSGNEAKKWKIVANVNQNQAQVIALNHLLLTDPQTLNSSVEEDIAAGTQQLRQLVAAADGGQLTADPLKDARHYANVLFNIMRGGIFDQNYQTGKADFVSFLQNANKEVAQRNELFIRQLPEEWGKPELDILLAARQDSDLIRLCKEYLPLKFSRRHGDPSRPWNYFSINTHNELDGSKVLDYEGNWRDIFQNWEALAHSYPDFVEGMIYKFLNATTFDGYNPYRVTKGGFDWEVIEHDNPWSYIGYWGDHQIIYLLKFLEFYRQYQPQALPDLLNCNHFVYANVPYKIKTYPEIVQNPKDTIVFDEQADLLIRQKIAQTGADGALLGSAADAIHRVSFLEKILATVLAKMSNFIPEAGIWMNTQRPEWNDANNALVGNGVSMVTLYYLRRFLTFFDNLLSDTHTGQVAVSAELHTFFTNIAAVLTQYQPHLSGNISNGLRKTITDALGQAGSQYRQTIYQTGFSGSKTELSVQDVARFTKTALQFAEQAIAANKRPDDLYHAYNLISITDREITVSHLTEMLEGQVAVISSGYLTAGEVVTLLNSLRNSALYRKDQNSYLLYPNKELPRFLEKNNIPAASVKKSRLLQQLLHDQNYLLINRDVEGGYHFNGNFTNAADVKTALQSLMANTAYQTLVQEETGLVLAIFEEVFNHKAFTGRSGTFYAYEGLGSVYWHMVSKLHLAVQEACIWAFEQNANAATLKTLAAHYYEIGEGIGIHKPAELYGAFPTDPYSHTPLHRGAQQPGMTGQVKEDILVKFGELGVFIHRGKLVFQPFLLKQEAFLPNPQSYSYFNSQSEQREIALTANSLAFTYCQTPIIYQIGNHNHIAITFSNGNTQTINDLSIDAETSRHVFQRTNAISNITVSLQVTQLLK